MAATPAELARIEALETSVAEFVSNSVEVTATTPSQRNVWKDAHFPFIGGRLVVKIENATTYTALETGDLSPDVTNRKWQRWNGSQWEDFTASTSITVDNTIIGGSTNPVEGNAIFDALATIQGLVDVNTAKDGITTQQAADITANNAKISMELENILTSTDTTKALTAAQGKVLKDLIDNINTLLTSDDTTLDELQEVVDFIKQNKTTLDALGISNIAGLQNALDTKEDLLPTAITDGEVIVKNIDGSYEMRDAVLMHPDSEIKKIIKWVGTQSAYDALPQATRDLPNFEAIITDGTQENTEVLSQSESTATLTYDVTGSYVVDTFSQTTTCTLIKTGKRVDFYVDFTLPRQAFTASGNNAVHAVIQASGMPFVCGVNASFNGAVRITAGASVDQSVTSVKAFMDLGSTELDISVDVMGSDGTNYTTGNTPLTISGTYKEI